MSRLSPASPFGIYRGTVIAVDAANRGIKIQSATGAILPPDNSWVSLDLSPDDQYLPEVGDGVIYVQYESEHADYWICPLRFTANTQSSLRFRGGTAPMISGEKQVQGVGGSYIYFDAVGNVYLVDGSMGGYVKLDNLSQEIMLKQDSVEMSTNNGVSVRVDHGGGVTLVSEIPGDVHKHVTLDPNGILLDYDDQKSIIKIDGSGITIKGEKIFLDGTVYLGAGASDEVQRLAFGDVVTGGPLGTHPVDYVTGIPIVGSTTIKAKGV